MRFVAFRNSNLAVSCWVLPSRLAVAALTQNLMRMHGIWTESCLLLPPKLLSSVGRTFTRWHLWTHKFGHHYSAMLRKRLHWICDSINATYVVKECPMTLRFQAVTEDALRWSPSSSCEFKIPTTTLRTYLSWWACQCTQLALPSSPRPYQCRPLLRTW